jgi:hypothetical protein
MTFVEAEDVLTFRRKFGHPVSPAPVLLTQRRLVERTNAMLDELKEFAAAGGLTLCGGKFVPTHPEQDLAGQADGLVDLVYFALGTVAMQGLPWYPLWHDVHAANMRKVAGATGDIIKPPGWIGPQTQYILEMHGYDPDDPTRLDDAEHSR